MTRKHVFSAVVLLTVLTGCLKGSYEMSDYIGSDLDALDRLYIIERDSVYNILPFVDRGYIGYNNRHRDYDAAVDGEDASEDIRQYGTFTGGFSISMKCDTIVKPGHVTRSPFCVADSTGNGRSEVFAVYYQNPDDSKNPEHDLVYLAGGIGSCTPAGCFVQNTNLVANIIVNGTEDIPPFAQGDYLKLTATAIVGDAVSGTAEIYLANYTEKGLSILDKWTEFPLTEIRDMDYLDFTLTSNRTDIPLWFCMDDFTAKIFIKQ